MKIRKPDYFDKFNCIADKCEDTCCAGWGIVIDKESYNKYLKVKGEFGERLRNEIYEEEGEQVFKLKGDDCSFLNSNGFCDIYSNLGGDSLCYTCRQYPRYLEEFGSLREIGLSLSCPEACRIILNSKEKVEFVLSNNDEEVNSINDINPNLYINLLQCRKIVLEILRDRSIDLKIRASLILVFIDEVQGKIDNNNFGEIKAIKDKYLDKGYIDLKIKEINTYKNKESVRYNNIKEVFNIFKGLKHINPNDPLNLDDALRYFWQSTEDEELYIKLNSDFEKYYSQSEYKYEQILVYYVYRYFMKAVFDYDAIAKIKNSIISYIMIKELAKVRYLENKEFTDEDMVDIAHTYSKDVEHLEENIETLEEIFESNEVCSVENFLINIIN